MACSIILLVSIQEKKAQACESCSVQKKKKYTILMSSLILKLVAELEAANYESLGS